MVQLNPPMVNGSSSRLYWVRWKLVCRLGENGFLGDVWGIMFSPTARVPQACPVRGSFLAQAGPTAGLGPMEMGVVFEGALFGVVERDMKGEITLLLHHVGSKSRFLATPSSSRLCFLLGKEVALEDWEGGWGRGGSRLVQKLGAGTQRLANGLLDNWHYCVYICLLKAAKGNMKGRKLVWVSFPT